MHSYSCLLKISPKPNLCHPNKYALFILNYNGGRKCIQFHIVNMQFHYKRSPNTYYIHNLQKKKKNLIQPQLTNFYRLSPGIFTKTLFWKSSWHFHTPIQSLQNPGVLKRSRNARMVKRIPFHKHNVVLQTKSCIHNGKRLEDVMYSGQVASESPDKGKEKCNDIWMSNTSLNMRDVGGRGEKREHEHRHEADRRIMWRIKRTT